MMRSRPWALVLALVLLTSCGKSVRVGGRFAQTDSGDDTGACTADQTLHWSWTQPDALISHSVDLLFVVDTSLSLIPERIRLARSIPRFVDMLPESADTRIAVMLAHGPKSRWNGRLFSRRHHPAVLDVHSLSPARVQAELGRRLASVPPELHLSNGEMMLGSLQRSLEPERVAEIQRHGFYRDGAALSIVFVSDENDLCFDPRAHGYTGFPDYKGSLLGIESRAFRKYCLNPESGTLAISPESVLSTLRDRFPEKKISLAGIIHLDPKHVSHLGEDSIGHGILELVSSVRDGLPLELTQPDYSPGLEKLGSIVSSQLKLMTTFPLGQSWKIDPTSIRVRVDGHEVAGTFDQSQQTVAISAQAAGGAGSTIEVSACPLGAL